jgi:phosphohistidine phosphatase
VKTVLLFRHAKSDWDAEYRVDHERPLAKRGRKAAVLIGKFLAAAGETPNLVISSSAKRAQDTARRAVEKGGWGCHIVIEPRLYGASEEGILETLRGVSESVETVLLVGHEPMWSIFAGALVGGADIRFPTGAVIRIDLAVDDWDSVRPASGTLVWMVTPRQIEAIGWDAKG